MKKNAVLACRVMKAQPATFNFQVRITPTLRDRLLAMAASELRSLKTIATRALEREADMADRRPVAHVRADGVIISSHKRPKREKSTGANRR
jgi:hypothetical protein